VIFKLKYFLGLKPFEERSNPSDALLIHNEGKTIFIFTGENATKAYRIGVISVDKKGKLKVDFDFGQQARQLLAKAGISVKDYTSLLPDSISGNRLRLYYQTGKMRGSFWCDFDIDPDGEPAMVPNSVKYDNQQ